MMHWDKVETAQDVTRRHAYGRLMQAADLLAWDRDARERIMALAAEFKPEPIELS